MAQQVRQLCVRSTSCPPRLVTALTAWVLILFPDNVARGDLNAGAHITHVGDLDEAAGLRLAQH